jgi:galactose-1-phosphate uridylyltransferase
MWNCLWKSGASLIHGHMQLTSSEIEYGRLRHLREISEGYEEIFGTDYFDDLYLVHESLGLGRKSGKSKVMFCITPKKEKEIMAFSKAKSFTVLSPIIFRLIQSYKNWEFKVITLQSSK